MRDLVAAAPGSPALPRRMLTALLLLSCASEAPGHDKHAPDGATVHHRFDDAEHWSEVFDDPERDAWQKPEEVVKHLELSPGMTVADIGAGTGYFNPHLARAVGPEGKVIAVDIEATLIAHMAERAKADHTPQVEARQGKADDPALKANEVDRVLLVDTYHHIGERRAYFTRLTEAMTAGGRLVVVDFKPGEIPVGPPEKHRIPEAKVIEELKVAGWTQVERHELPYQFSLTFEVSSPK